MSRHLKIWLLASSLLAFGVNAGQSASAQPSPPMPTATTAPVPAGVPSVAPAVPPLQGTTMPLPVGSGAPDVAPLSPSGLEPTRPTSNALPPLSGSVELRDVLQEAEARNPDVVAANAAIAVAQARVQQATTTPLQFVVQPSIAQDVPGGAGQVQLLTAGIQQQIAPGFGAAKRLAGYDVSLSRAAADATRRDVRQRVVTAYYALAGTQARTSAAEQNLRSANELVAAARLRQRAGAIGSFEVLRATVEARRAQSELLQARGALRQAAIILGAVVGRLVDPAASLSLAPVAPSSALSAAGSLASALARDPTSVQLRATLARSGAQFNVARAQRLPTFAIAGGYTLERAPSLGNLTSRGPTGAIGLTLPIVDYGTIRGAEREARANAAATRAQISGRELQLRAAIEGAIADVESNRARLDFAGESLRQATEGLRVAQIGFRAGALGTLDVISARTAATTARADRDQAGGDYAAAVARLHILVGDPIAP